MWYHQPMNYRTITKKLSFKLITLVIASVALAVITFSMKWQDVGSFWSYVNVAKMLLASIIAYIVVFWRAPAKQQYTLFKWAAVSAVVMFAIFAVLVLLLDPNLANQLVLENHAFENIQAWFLFIGAAFLLVATIRLARAGRKVEAIGAAIMCLVLFLIGGEEISWGMWLFHDHADAFFQKYNTQGETNFHNMDTFLSEDLYYFGAFVWLVMVPFFKDSIMRLFKRLKVSSLETILPSVWMFMPWAVMAGFVAPYSYKQSTILLGFFASALVLVYTVFVSAKQSKARVYGAIVLLALLFIVGFVFSFSWQSTYIDHLRGGAPKEYMETLTSFGLFIYAIDIYARLFVRSLAAKPSLVKRVLSKI